MVKIGMTLLGKETKKRHPFDNCLPFESDERR